MPRKKKFDSLASVPKIEDAVLEPVSVATAKSSEPVKRARLEAGSARASKSSEPVVLGSVDAAKSSAEFFETVARQTKERSTPSAAKTAPHLRDQQGRKRYAGSRAEEISGVTLRPKAVSPCEFPQPYAPHSPTEVFSATAMVDATYPNTVEMKPPNTVVMKLKPPNTVEMKPPKNPPKRLSKTPPKLGPKTPPKILAKTLPSILPKTLPMILPKSLQPLTPTLFPRAEDVPTPASPEPDTEISPHPVAGIDAESVAPPATTARYILANLSCPCCKASLRLRANT